MQNATIAGLAVDGAEASLQMVRSVLKGESGPAADIVALNAGAAIYVAGLRDSLAAGVSLAQQVIQSGEAAAKLEALATLSNQLAA